HGTNTSQSLQIWLAYVKFAARAFARGLPDIGDHVVQNIRRRYMTNKPDNKPDYDSVGGRAASSIAYERLAPLRAALEGSPARASKQPPTRPKASSPPPSSPKKP